ncbi:putative hydrophobic surface binding protein [Lyophyllum shimeji]|uniref:Hydrophobic surface binding protein n=1 Tax=Lyophyllum shimeji TaxID=47721 RepID=A0A9P3UMQ9_LYOSH|nr:putative hydrophobic surface binding protein [Lyophyllum shimeji]
MRFFGVLALASLFVSGFASTVADVEADISIIADRLTTLDNSITAFPSTGGTLAQALTIHSNSQNAITALNQGTTDAQNVAPLPISEADSRSILTAFETLEPIIEHILGGLITKKPAFDALLGGITGLVTQDLRNLDASFTAFENAICAGMPADLVGECEAVKGRIDAAFAAANAAYP